ncbi:MAG: tRNA uridine-5-carboxymethylaminomethyl(34) synthesis GTPase MnmE [Deltaproteobacteria bacterium]|nr:tRNA uridine-5-carboxymethylaminomethyl(34) synthesis GTPase MnmE [Deltaproteobacteria bacterium]
MPIEDTIAAIATAPGSAGVAIIRISGPNALDIGSGVFCSQSKIQTYEHAKMYYGRMVSEKGETIDDVFFVYLKGPKTYTGEDTVEFHCHGGVLIVRLALEAVLKQGARLALPGEFTKRAFLNNRIDLGQAAAVSDLINASSVAALRNARGRLEGGLSRKINLAKGPLIDVISRLDAELDFPDEGDVREINKVELEKSIKSIEKNLEYITLGYKAGVALKEGVRTVILGRPNAGKSSLLNLLLREERAIVTAEPGTTRDVIEEMVVIRGIGIRLADTAGIREGAGKVESVGIERAKEKAKNAGIILYVTDGSADATEFAKDTETIKSLKTEGRTIVILNKVDTIGDKRKCLQDGQMVFGKITDKIVLLSATKNEGLKELEDAICAAAGQGGEMFFEAEAGEVITTLREKTAVEKAMAALSRALKLIDDNGATELIAFEIKAALDALGEITGETTPEEILDNIFSNFCIGK